VTSYRARTFVPPLVEQAHDLETALGFSQSCKPEVGRLLCTLAAHVRDGTIGEIGTGAGVGTAWMASGLGPAGSLTTVELDDARAAAARHLFAPYPNVCVLHGDWTLLLEHGPFDLLFVDAPTGQALGMGNAAVSTADDWVDRLLAAVRAGGLIVIDDLTPEAAWPEAWRGQPDPKRELWLNDPRLTAIELIVDPAAGLHSAVIVATYLGPVPAPDVISTLKQEREA
jgi:predicted O-methyltransferase YrrM